MTTRRLQPSLPEPSRRGVGPGRRRRNAMPWETRESNPSPAQQHTVRRVLHGLSRPHSGALGCLKCMRVAIRDGLSAWPLLSRSSSTSGFRPLTGPRARAMRATATGNAERPPAPHRLRTGEVDPQRYNDHPAHHGRRAEVVPISWQQVVSSRLRATWGAPLVLATAVFSARCVGADLIRRGASDG
jgi:hypothetical protein